MKKSLIGLIIVLLFMTMGCIHLKSGAKNSDSDQDFETSKEFLYYNPAVVYRGTNLLPRDPEEKFKDAAEIYNMNIIRLICGDNEYKSLGYKDSFLYGDTNNFTQLRTDHLAILDQCCSWGKKYGLSIIVDMHHAAGRQWTWTYEHKIHEDFAYHEMTAEFWRQMAEYYKDEGAYLMFDIMNEPRYLEKYGEELAGWDTMDKDADGFYTEKTITDYMAYVKDTPADLNRLYTTVISAIRAIDEDRTIIIEPDYWAGAEFMRTLHPVYKKDGSLDENVWYSFHFYVPNSFTHQENNFSGEYPGVISDEWDTSYWNKERLRGYFERVESWRTKHGIPASSILCGEFNACRFAPGTARWLLDVTNLLEEYGYNWTYYMFREDQWDYMDCELGTSKSNTKRNFSGLMKILYEKFKYN